MNTPVDRTCNRCGRVHRAVTFEYALNHSSNFDMIYKCFECGNSWEDFHDTHEHECPVGVTLTEILYEEGNNE